MELTYNATYSLNFAFVPLCYNASPNIWKLRVSVNVIYSYNCGLWYLAMIVDLDDKKEKEFRDTVIKEKGFHKGGII